MFEAQAARTPTAKALTCGNEHLTYCELNARANQLAHYLRKRNIGPEIPVALYLDRSIQMVVAILGVLKAGGAYVPIDLAYPKDRLGFMLEDSEAPIIVTSSNLLDALPSNGPSIVCIDRDWDAIATESTGNPKPVLSPENAAYIIFTSGSTGKPKGVLVTHHNVVRLLKKTEHWYGFNETDVWPLFHSYAFDVSVFELWGCFFYGGRLVIVPYLVSRSPHDFYELLARERVTVLNQTPSAFRQIIWAEETAPVKHELCIRYVVCAGEALELQSLKPWFARHGDQKPKIVNMYGITEITVHATFRIIRKEDLENGMGSVFGVPIPDLQLYLVDEDLRPVPPGMPGEICVGGEGVARGYLKRPDLTAKRFLPDPFSHEAGATMYRSGDLAQINANGEMEYLGRMDHQVKIRGFRVELGEIESALNRHPSIRESVVIAQDGSEADKRLLAYVVPVGAAPNVSELRKYLGASLPEYMVPAVFVVLPSLPLTTNGKVDRRALPAPEGIRPRLASAFVAPSTPAEKTLIEIWEKVLQIDRIGIHDNFFELGGDSIRSISVLSRAEQKGLRFTLQQIFNHPTVATLAACQQGAPGESLAPSLPFSLITQDDRAKLPSDVEDAYPLTKLQLGMFFRNELDPLSAIYHDVFSYRIEAAWDVEKLEAAVNELAKRHPILRTSFQIAGFSEPLQLVHREVRIPFTSEELLSLGAEAQFARLAAWIEAEKRNAFDRARAPLLRFHAQRLADHAFQLIISFHHSCLDGWSLAAVMTEVVQDYCAALRNQPGSLKAPGITYRDFVALEKEALASPECRKFWADMFTGATLQTLPRWPREMCEGGHEQKRGPEIQIEAAVLAGLKRLGQQAGVPLKTVLLAAHQKVMSLLYGQTDITSGLLCNGRPETTDGDKLVGLFLNTLPVRTLLPGGTWMDLVKVCFQAEQQIIPHRRFPMAEIQKMTGGRSLFEAAFDFVHFHVYKDLEGSGDAGLMEGHYFEANDLTTFTTFMMDLTSTQLQIHIDYDPNVIARDQVERMTNYYVETVREMAARPEGRYEMFSPLSEKEHTQILRDWNNTATQYPRDKTIHELFHEQVVKTPNAVAVVGSDAALTFSALDDRANEVAGHLAALGVKSETLVGLCMERSTDLIVALLGVLKAGAAYVPLDPAYPAERLAQMVGDAKMPIIITQADLAKILPPSSAKIVTLPDLHTAASGITAPLPKASGDNLAYVIYTSGSTGVPKGVQITHRSVVNLLFSAQKTIGYGEQERLLAVTTLSFDIAALELFLPLITGTTLLLATREQAGDGTELASLLEASSATTMQATPATWRLLIDSGWQGKKDLKIICGGESLKRSLADELLKRCAGVWNFYGPTETTIWSTAGKVEPVGPITIGKPLANTRTYILDSNRLPVPAGVAGELFIGGDGVARGYFQRDSLTSEKFVPDLADPSTSMYRTGDLARHLLDGQIECLGRTDHQVKIRGFRIELGDIEAVMRQQTGISEAVVTARENSAGEKRLVAYFVSKTGDLDANELREAVKKRLPLYMVPSVFVPLRELPLTPNGKIDMNRLPAPEEAAPTAKNCIAPRNHEEAGIAEIWQDVLSLKQVGVEDNFFESGGDSLSATRAFARINRKFGSGITLREMFEHPTIAGLARIIGRSDGAPVSTFQPIPRRPRTGI